MIASKVMVEIERLAQELGVPIISALVSEKVMPPAVALAYLRRQVAKRRRALQRQGK